MQNPEKFFTFDPLEGWKNKAVSKHEGSIKTETFRDRKEGKRSPIGKRKDEEIDIKIESIIKEIQ